MEANNYCAVYDKIVWGVGTTKAKAAQDAKKTYDRYYNGDASVKIFTGHRLENDTLDIIMSSKFDNKYTITDDDILVANEVLVRRRQAELRNISFEDMSVSEYSEVYNIGTKLDILFEGIKMILKNQR